jgi:heat shock protein HtpX
MNNVTSSQQNVRKSWIIVLLFIVFLATIGFLIGKLPGSMITAFFGTLYALIALFQSDRLILSSLKAKKILRENNAHLYATVRELAEAGGLPTPELYYLEDTCVNILSLGQSQTAGKLIMTTGLVERLTGPEAEAAFAHELAHIKMLDTRLGALTTTIIGIFPFYAELLHRKGKLFYPVTFILNLFSPLSALLMHLVLSPKREFEADATGVLITRYPEGLSKTLRALTETPHKPRHVMRATAHLFLTNPYGSHTRDWFTLLFMTHPPLSERIKVLESL